MEPLTNWAGNLTYSAARIHRPATLDELQALVARCSSLRALGTRHSFNTIADTAADLVALDGLSQIAGLDRERRTVTVEGGVRYGELCRWLHDAGFALHNLASLPHISVAGACATGTHGSGDGNGNLATAVTALELVTADGELLALSAQAEPGLLRAAVVSLGALGVVARLTLAVEPAFTVRQHMYEGLALDQLAAQIDAILGMAYSVSIFTDWRDARRTQVLLKRRVSPDDPGAAEAELFGAPRATGPRHPIADLPADNCTEQLGVPGPWHERLPHFRLEFTPSVGVELQSEYFVPRARAGEAVAVLRSLAPQLASILQISELRSIAADELWLSPCYRRASVGLHFTWIKDWAAVRAVLPHVEAALLPLEARPHWGKLFTLDPAAIRPAYERLPDFQQLMRRYDPRGKFRNPFIESYLA